MMGCSETAKDLTMIKGEFRERKDPLFPWKIVAIGLLVLSCFLGYRQYQALYYPLIAGIPPNENADGTIDYTIVTAANSIGIQGQEKELRWVLRLPKEVHVDDHSEDGPRIASARNGSLIKLNPLKPNTLITFSLNPSSLELSTATPNIQDKTLLDVTVGNIIFPPTNWQGVVKNLVDQETCQELPSSLAGVKFYASISDSAVTALQREHPSRYLVRCDGTSSNPLFSFSNSYGTVLAVGTCHATICEATLWLSNHHLAWSKFPLTELHKLFEFRQSLINLLNKHTVQLDKYPGQTSTSD